MRVRLFEMGHSFESIDNMSVQDYNDVIGYLAGESSVNGATQKDKKMLRGK